MFVVYCIGCPRESLGLLAVGWDLGASLALARSIVQHCGRGKQTLHVRCCKLVTLDKMDLVFALVMVRAYRKDRAPVLDDGHIRLMPAFGKRERNILKIK